MQTFRKLQNALDYDGGCTRSIYQYGIPARAFIVASEREFYNKIMRGVVTSERNYYEVIKPDKPCHLHLDLDLNCQKHPSIEIADVWKTIQPYIDGCIEDMGHEIEKCIIMDSSNDKKGSYHILYKLKNHIFASSAHVGAFLRCLYTHQIHKLPDIRFVWNEFVDMGIYTRNRLFRMLSCTKKSDPTRVLRWEGHPCCFETWQTCKIQPVTTSRQEIECTEPGDNNTPAQYMGSKLQGRSRFDVLEDIFKEFASTIGPVKRIFWMRKYLQCTITLESKFCIFKNDYHSKNTNYIVVDILTNQYYLKCWNKTYACCKNARSAPKPLPPDILEKIMDMHNFSVDPSVNIC